MLRSTLIYLSKAAWARRMVTQWDFAWNAASRFVAGDKLEDAIRVIQTLNQKGINATLDHLGEHVTTPDEARLAAQEIIKAIDAIREAGVRANVSVKLSQLGVMLDVDLCAENLKTILSYAKESGNFVRIDMEDATTVDTTLALHQRMCTEHGLTNTGLVIQSYLYRSEADVQRIVAAGGRVRLCKGTYREAPHIAFPQKADVDANYDLLAKLLIDGALKAGSPTISPDCKVPPIPAMATHDPKRIAHAKAYAAQVGLPKEALEFQMLYGIRRDLQDQAAREGYPVRVYVPYGTEWYPYFVRRLAERPANLWFFISNYFK